MKEHFTVYEILQWKDSLTFFAKSKILILQSFIIDAEDIRREKGIYTREKNTLFLKNLTEVQSDGNMKLLENIRRKYQLEDMKFEDFFAGPEPVFEVSKRGKCGPSGMNILF